MRLAQGGRALADRVEQARPKELVARVVFLNVEMAGAELEHPLQQLQRFAQGVDTGEGPEDLGALELSIAGRAGDEDARELVAHGDGDVGEALAIREAFVVLGLDVLDETVLSEERLPLTLAEQVLEAVDLVEHGLLLGTQVRRGHEVAGDAIAQGPGLADVEDDALRVLHEIDAGLSGQLMSLGEQFIQLGSAGRHGTMVRSQGRFGSPSASRRVPASGAGGTL